MKQSWVGCWRLTGSGQRLMNDVKMKILSEFDLTEEEVTYFREADVGLNGIDIQRVSWFLSAQLAFARKSRLFSSFAVTDVIQRLEGRGRGSSVKSAQPFKHNPLKGFWKAHFFDARFIIRNLINEWGLEYENSPKFYELCNKVTKDEEECPSPLGWQGRLAHELVFGGFEERTRRHRITGEWLVFAEYTSEKYYLCIANHSDNTEDDNKLHDLIVSTCGNDFPYLFNQLNEK